jgi:drug/metabolite transporter (DMT)-like permease
MAALTFGVSTPISKQLVGAVHPVLLAGLLYLGSGLGLAACLLIRKAIPAAGSAGEPLRRADIPWLAAITLFGGVMAPVLLMAGLSATPASSASLLLNMEMVFTLIIAWVVFKENVDLRLLLGAALIVAGSCLLGWTQWPGFSMRWGTLAILGACLCWALDNNLTRKLAAADALQVAAIKGLAAGIVNLSLGLALGFQLPGVRHVLAGAAMGFVGYGLSLVLFIMALRNLGTARTSAYFSLAPFAGAALAILMFGETPPAAFALAAALMAAGIYLHLSERHIHAHEHPAVAHTHRHKHVGDHQHQHDDPVPEWEAHSHPHTHVAVRHRHAHVPDVEHQHRH